MADYKLPIKVIILNNSGYGIIKQFQDTYFNSRYTVCLHGRRALTARSLHLHCTAARPLYAHRTVSARSPHSQCTLTAQSVHGHCTVTALCADSYFPPKNSHFRFAKQRAVSRRHVPRHVHSHVYSHVHGHVYRHLHRRVYRRVYRHVCRRMCRPRRFSATDFVSLAEVYGIHGP